MTGGAALRLMPHVPGQLRAEVQAEQFLILRRQVPILYVVLLINIAILCFSVFGSVPIALSFGVPSLFVALITGRMAVWLARPKMARSSVPISRYLLTTKLTAALMSAGSRHLGSGAPPRGGWRYALRTPIHHVRIDRMRLLPRQRATRCLRHDFSGDHPCYRYLADVRHQGGSCGGSESVSCPAAHVWAHRQTIWLPRRNGNLAFAGEIPKPTAIR